MVNENRNLKSGHSILTEWAVMIKFADKLNDDEKEKLEFYNRCLINIPIVARRIVQAKYVQLARFYQNRNRDVQITDPVSKRYSLTRADDYKVSQLLGIPKYKISKFDKPTRILVAKIFREEMLKEHKIVKELVEKELITDKSLIVDTVNKFKLKYDDVTFTTSYITKSKRLLKIRYYQTVWKPRGVEEHEKSDNAL